MALGCASMNLAARLETMRQGVPGCTLVAFGDLGTRLVLRCSAETSPPQEILDELCTQAEHGFFLQDALLGADTAHDRTVAEVSVVTPHETRMYIRVPGAADETANDAILCVCDTEKIAREMIAPAKTLLDDLSRGA